MIRPSRKEILRYMGYRGIQADPQTDKAIDMCIHDLEKVIEPRSLTRSFSAIVKEDDITVDSVHFHSNSLYRNMKGCTEAVLMICTLGTETDRLIRRREFTSLFEASCLQAAAAAYIETYCDSINEQIKADAHMRGLYCRPRFSPGYGDLDLSSQRDFFHLMRPENHIGVMLSDSFMMVPSKSVSAIIGLAPYDTNCILQGCEECSMAGTCEYSRIQEAEYDG